MSKRGENIYKRKDNRWEARYIKGHSAQGAVKYGYCYGKTYREAKQKAADAKAALATGKTRSPSSGSRCLAYYCDEWLRINRCNVKESTHIKYKGILEKHIKPYLGGYTLSALSTCVVEQFGYELLNDVGLSPKTVKDVLAVFHSVIKYAGRHSGAAVPMIEIAYPKVPKKEMRVLTRNEQARLMDYLQDGMDDCKFGILLALLTGMRVGELCALQWKNVNLAEKTIRVTATMQRLQNLADSGSHKTKVVISEPKSDSSVRTIPLTDFAVNLCRGRQNNMPTAFVLTGETDRYLEPRSLQYRFKRYTAACGLEGVHFHTLRHTFATRCVEVDFELKSLSEILGHANPRITLERYVHSSMELKRDNMKKLASIGF